MAVLRRQEKEKAEQQFPELQSLFKKINAELNENLAKGRFAYRKSLEEIYRRVWDWNADGSWDDIQKTIARLRGVALRSDANRFSGIVAICCDRNRNTVSRWSQELEEAFVGKIPPKRFIRFLEG
jgi:hypothetical protein